MYAVSKHLATGVLLSFFQLEVIGLNRQDYETRRVLLTLDIQQKEMMARHEVELKIDNLNVEDLLDEHKYVPSTIISRC